MRTDTQQQRDWSGNLEQLEDRLYMSADPLGGLLGGSFQHHAIAEDLPPAVEHHAIVEEPPALDHHLNSEADFWIDHEKLDAIDQELGRIEQSLANAHDQSGLSQVRTDYGFDGTGQTVAVIDSGIAYDHFALGGGLGANYRVVGGWDFTGENDANPYDDGGAGSHGTHVSGIIGASGGTHTGVAPGVDLVGLRVFDDVGNGYFSWVENALDWVHTNRNSFENPITAVNLSLGVASWNADAIPSWANLEDEFAQLEADGIFVAVSAGNSFTSFNAAGLSYPAASPYVIPVASVDDSGLLSYFSQRNSRVIAAPGRGIISTVPDYAGNNNGTVDDYASFSGTSMASPYVAGASVIIREAMEFAGYTNITQDTIYDHMIDTADSFYDSPTNAYYNRLNLESAIDALIPTDDFGSSVGAAHNLGTISTSTSISGLIGTLDDQDYFSFTAGSTGTMSFSATADHGLSPSYSVNGASGTVAGNTLTFEVVAGETYTVSLETAAGEGIGYYDAELSLDAVYTEPYTIKSVVRSPGVVYSLDSENWLLINDNRLWSNTADFSVAANRHFVWQGTTGILQRFTDGGWSTFDRDAEKHQVNTNSLVYSLGEDNMVSINGTEVWGSTNDFYINDDNDVYWHSTSGVLQKLSSSGGWTTLDRDVQEFAIRSDGTAYALTGDGNVTVNGVQTWSNVNDLWLDNTGQLVIQSNGGGLSYEAGSFSLCKELGLSSNQVVETSTSTNDAQAAAASVAQASTQAFAGLSRVSTSSSRVRFDLGRLSRASFSQAVDQQAGSLTASREEIDNRAFSNWEDSASHDDSTLDFASFADQATLEEDALATLGAVDSWFEQIGEIV